MKEPQGVNVVFSEDNLTLLLTSIGGFLVGVFAHLIQFSVSNRDRVQKNRHHEADTLKAVIAALRAELKEAQQTNVDLRELNYKHTLEAQDLRHKLSQKESRAERLQEHLTKAQKSLHDMGKEKLDLMSRLAELETTASKTETID